MWQVGRAEGGTGRPPWEPWAWPREGTRWGVVDRPALAGWGKPGGAGGGGGWYLGGRLEWVRVGVGALAGARGASVCVLSRVPLVGWAGRGKAMAGSSPTAVGQGSGGDVWCRGSALLAAVWGDGGGAGVQGGGTVCWCLFFRFSR